MTLRLSSGSLLRVGAALANSADCCCVSYTCCTFDPTRELYLTEDNFTLDAGCDADCVGLTVAGKVNFGGVQSVSDLVSFLSENCADHEPYIISVTLLCDTTHGHIVVGVSGGRQSIIDNCADNNTQCYIEFAGSAAGSATQILGEAVCDPFYIQASVDVIIYESDGSTQCATGTIRITITE